MYGQLSKRPFKRSSGYNEETTGEGFIKEDDIGLRNQVSSILQGY
jgi:hypothetical protein